MSWKLARGVAITLLGAAISCAEARHAEAGSQSGPEGERHSTGAAGSAPAPLDPGAAGRAPPPFDAGAPAEKCPRQHPPSGTACRVPETTTCTYRGDGPCSPTNPDRISVCAGGVWGSLAAGIDCRGVDADAAVGRAIDCNEPLTLADYCNREGRDCSVTFKTLRESYCSPMYRHITTTMFANRCGSRTLFTRIGNSSMRFDFDMSGQLHSVQSKDDVPFGPCMRSEYVYGEPCGLIEDDERPACSALPEDDAGSR